MMKRIALLLLVFVVSMGSDAQNVGIGTQNPKNKLHVAGGLRVDTLANGVDSGLLRHDKNGAVYSLKFTGNENDVLKGDGSFGAAGSGAQFPLMTTEERDLIASPVEGMHIFNTDEQCLNYYNKQFDIWLSYCDAVQKVIMIRLSSDVTGGIDFYNTYAKKYPGVTRFLIIVNPGVTLISGSTFPDPFYGTIPLAALNFIGMPAQLEIKIINYGTIIGLGGSGGHGAWGAAGSTSCNGGGEDGTGGGVAIATPSADISISVENYGTISGGGGGGGGGGRNVLGEYGGGGGGGAATGSGGAGGGATTSILGSCLVSSVAQNGTPGLTTTVGTGGAGANGGSKGGDGGSLAQPGQNGTGASAGIGGQPGVTVFSLSGPSEIVINNHGSGQVMGVVQ